jgi:hypothetical protein
MAWALLLLPPYTSDPTTLINILSGLADDRAWDRQLRSTSILHLVSAFLMHALEQPPLVAERATDLLGVLPVEVLTALPKFDELISVARSKAEAVDDPLVRDELVQCVNDASQAFASGEGLARYTSTARLRVDIADTISSIPPSGAAAAFAFPGLTRLEAYLIGLSCTTAIPVVQRIRLKSARSSEPNLDDRRVGAGFNAWSKFNEWWTSFALGGREVRLLPAGATIGSFQLDLILEPVVGVGSESVLEAADMIAEYARNDQALPEGEPWRQLVEVLTEFGLTMTVVHYWGNRESKALELNRTSMQAVRERIVAGPYVKISSIDVPQANKIEKVFDVAESISRAELIEMDVRDLNYYRRAAKILGLIDRNDALTAGGRQVVRLSREERLRTAVVLFETSTVGEAWISYCQGATLMDVDVNTAKAFLTDRSVVTGDTLNRRAKALKAWHEKLIQYHYLRPL